MKFNYLHKLLLVPFSFLLCSCGDEPIPKPNCQLSLEYPSASYDKLASKCNFEFDVNTLSEVSFKENCALEVNYSKMKATLYLTYKPVDNNIEKLLRDAQKLTYEHVIKADDIIEQPFVNSDTKVYGMFYEVGGNAATNIQFYVTDSTKNFITGSLYFYSKPNFDSILPAANYIKADVRKIMETMKWK
ncbi:gliding motility lipoprotein GldD [Flavobacterium sp.]|jgi:gliding motility-associated lipoprotein GldD|uniref:gliding motility lipoprotein GldD n=1 Tax=Flavobacterium sp. TaxID=239 RepID=UPI002A810E42|nr:gliding motility lipoprotein GldD [Flavobacterium sp.]